MSERMEQIGGKLTIKSRPGIGTRVMLETPLGKTAEEPT
jgi:signal transduction histidine kinase